MWTIVNGIGGESRTGRAGGKARGTNLERDRAIVAPMRNTYFDLTEEFNAEGRIVALASGQAVVFYRLALMSKDGDWILRETPEACRRVLDVLEKYGARYRPGAPLDVRWLGGGWSSHFEFSDPQGRRIRCDFLSRPPRVSSEEVNALFVSAQAPDPMLVVGVEPLIRMKQTQRAKDYPVIGELARLLPPEREIELTTDPDRILALAPAHGGATSRLPVQVARAGGSREDIIIALAREVDRLQQEDRARLERYRTASEPYLRELQAARIGDLELPYAQERICEIAERMLPYNPLETGG